MSMRYVHALFKDYYRRSFQPPDVPEMGRREIAYQLFGSDSMVRHKSVPGEAELRRLFAEASPRHAYYSSSYFEKPGEPDMSLKEWRGADLVFDIDGDHLQTRNCAGVKLMTLACLDDARLETIKLIDILTNEFGVASMRITFSGNRGFHVHVEAKEVIQLGQEERREIVNYITAKGDLTRQLIAGGEFLLDVADAKSIRRDMGGPARVLKAVLDVLGRKPKPADVAGRRDEVLRRLGVTIDEVVTIDVNRLIRMPNTLHGKTGLKVAELGVGDVERGVEAVLGKAIAFSKGSIAVKLNEPVGEVLGEPVKGRAGSVVVLPQGAAVYLLLSGSADLARGEAWT